MLAPSLLLRGAPWLRFSKRAAASYAMKLCVGTNGRRVATFNAAYPSCMNLPRGHIAQLHRRLVWRTHGVTDFGSHKSSFAAAAAVADIPQTVTPTINNDNAPTKDTFARLGVDKRLLLNLRALAIVAPSPIQSAAIPQILAKADCALQSYTGSGKTLAYLLPALTQILGDLGTRPRERSVQVLILAPSQELCMQIVNVAKSVGGEILNGHLQQCIGGANMARQVEALKKRKPSLVVGTPGRVAQLGRMGKLGLHHVKLLIVDEVDQLLADGFMEDMRWVVEHTGRKAAQARQTVLVSATLTPSVLARAGGWCNSPRYISAGPTPVLEPEVKPDGGSPEQQDSKEAGTAKPAFGWGNQGWDGAESEFYAKTKGAAGGVEEKELVPAMPPNLRHYYIISPRARKVDTLRKCLHALNIQRALVFHNFQQRVQDTLFKLEANKMDVGMLHGELNKMHRAQVLRDFKGGSLRALVVSDVVARGLDVPACDAVFHAELASSASHYAHRAGRTGRMGADGSVITIAEPGERWVVEKLAKKLNVPILEAHLSHGKLVLGPDPDAPKPKPKKDKGEVASKTAAAANSKPTTTPRSEAKDTPTTSSSFSSSSPSSSQSRSSLLPLSAAKPSTQPSTAGTSSGSLNQARDTQLSSRSGSVPPGSRASSTARSTSGEQAAVGRGSQDQETNVDEEQAWQETAGDELSELESGAAPSRQWHPQQKQKFDKILKQAGLSITELQAFNDDEEDDEEDEEPIQPKDSARRRKQLPKLAGSGLSKRVLVDVSAELEELRREKLRARQTVLQNRQQNAVKKSRG